MSDGCLLFFTTLQKNGQAIPGMEKEGNVLEKAIVRRLLWQAVSRKTSRCVELIMQDTFHYGRVSLYDRFCLRDVGVEYSDPGFITLISYGKDDAQKTFSAKTEIAPGVFPDDAAGVRPIEVGTLGQDDNGVRFCRCHHLLHEFVGNGIHAGVLFASKYVFCISFHTKEPIAYVQCLIYLKTELFVPGHIPVHRRFQVHG